MVYLKLCLIGIIKYFIYIPAGACAGTWGAKTVDIARVSVCPKSNLGSYILCSSTAEQNKLLTLWFLVVWLCVRADYESMCARTAQVPPPTTPEMCRYFWLGHCCSLKAAQVRWFSDFQVSVYFSNHFSKIFGQAVG